LDEIRRRVAVEYRERLGSGTWIRLGVVFEFGWRSWGLSREQLELVSVMNGRVREKVEEVRGRVNVEVGRGRLK
jgi:hypothetical protein